MDKTLHTIDSKTIIDYLINDKNSLSIEVEDYFEIFKNNRITRPKIFIGITSSSVIAGSGKTLDAINEYVSENNLSIDIEIVGSIGLCSDEPVVDIQLPGKNRISFRKIHASDVPMLLDSILNSFIPEEKVIGQYRNSIHEFWTGVPFMDEINFFRNQNRVVLSNAGIINPTIIQQYIARGGYSALAHVIRNFTFEEICLIIEKSGLRGRGGGGFPTGQKWLKALQTPADQRFIICNADESDPGAFLDRLLIESDPHRVIEGLAIGAYAIGANTAYIYTNSNFELTVQRLETAIEQAYKAGLLGHNILDSGYNIDIKVIKGPGAYVCGEETALIRSIEGKRGMPTVKPPYPSDSGLFGKPTVVNNIETLANIPQIILKGAGWFSAIGTDSSKGTKIFSISGKSANTCMVEVAMGTQLSTLVELAGGVLPGKKLKALHIGGPTGGCAIPDELNTPIDYVGLKEKGLSMGSGGIHILDDTVCIVDMVKYYMDFIHNESCGKCIPCREGSRRMLEILENISRRPITDDSHSTLERFKGVINLETIAEVMRDTSLCGLGQAAPNPVLRTIKLFRDEFEEHIFDRNCKSGVCQDLRTFYIDVEKCTGCNACAKKCPTNAIYGTPRSPYFIVEDKCIGCGICLDACKFGAVFFK